MNVLEWSINNFSHWDRNVHEKLIECPASDFTFCPHVKLYPRGYSGLADFFVVHVFGLPKASNLLTGQISFFDSSGCLISKQGIGEKKRDGDYFELLPGINFEEVAALLKKNKVSYEDRLIVRCELKWDFDIVYHLYTTIDVYDARLKIDCKILEDLAHKKYIFNIQCPVDSSKKFMYLCVTLEKSIFSITLKEPKYEGVFIVATEVSVLDNTNLLRTENNKHIFYNNESWPFLSSLTKEESSGYTLFLQIKITPSNSYRHHCGYFTRHSKVVDIMPEDYQITSKVHGKCVTHQLATASTSALSQELMCLYQDQDFSDFQLRCGEVTFPTHKNILCARSPVFKAMLSSGMKEASSDSMDISDLDVHTTALFLEFLYTGTVENLECESALRLYYAADKYQVLTLKIECFSVLLRSVSISNVCDILLLAHNHGDEELAIEAHNFILKNFNDVLRSDEWKKFMETEPLLAVKTVTFFAEKNSFRIFSD